MLTLLLKMLIIIVLLTLFFQDMLSRSVHWLLFPVLTGLFVSARCLAGEPLTSIGQSTLTNLAFIFLQLLLVTTYFSLKAGKTVNITSGLLGWGDVLFLTSTAFFFTMVSFVVFYLASLIVILLGWAIFLYLRPQHREKDAKEKADPTIPLAGLQAFLLAVGLLLSWLFPQSGLVKLTRELQTFERWS